MADDEDTESESRQWYEWVLDGIAELLSLV